MARNGSGTFNRLYDWTDDAANDINISSTRMDAEMDGMAQALTDSLAKDGQTTPTANLPMGGFKHTNVADATARTHYGKVSQIQDGSYSWCGTAGGTANAITLTPSPAITAYAAGQRFQFVAASNNTGPVTVNINGVGLEDITKRGSDALSSGDIVSGGLVEIFYDGTQFQLQGFAPAEDSQFILASQVFG